MDRNDIWHYPRTDLAQKYVETLNIGLSSALALFAPRRMGKTEFLRKDLTPAAESAGYWVIYVSLWEVKGDPGQRTKLPPKSGPKSAYRAQAQI